MMKLKKKKTNWTQIEPIFKTDDSGYETKFPNRRQTHKNHEEKFSIIKKKTNRNKKNKDLIWYKNKIIIIIIII